MALPAGTAPLATATASPGRLRRSFAYRSAFLWRRLLALLPPPRLAPKPPLPLTLLTFGGRGHGLMLRALASSLARAWPALPRLVAVTDGALPPRALARWLAPWPGRAEVVEPDRVQEGLGVRDREELRAFAGREVMGKKLAALAWVAERGPTLYVDADVLWFRYPARVGELLAAPAEEPVLVASEDYQASYDPRLVPDRLPHLARPPFYCAGLAYARGDFLAAAGVGELVSFAAAQGGWSTEQTLVAEAAHRLGGHTFERMEIACLDDDRYSLGPTYRGHPWAARHYVGTVRHLFWRDALALRLGIAPGARR
jgi:hypothetical protein